MSTSAPLQRSLRALKTLRSNLADRSGASPEQPQEERCELCAVPLLEKHQHLIDPSQRNIICCCDGCAILFDDSGVTQFRRVPRDVRLLADLSVPDEVWKELLVPIGLAFFYWSSYAGKIVALYPSSAGVTESVIDPEAWAHLTGVHPALTTLKPDIEALLVNRLRDERSYWIAPIDRCFELVGLVRRHWEGFSGGDRVLEEIRQFFSRLREVARP